MNLKSLPKQMLLNETEKLVQEERRITTAVLWHLFEIERRRLFAELGFASLFEYCTVQLKYSAGSAQRRIASMRLLREMPELEAKINSGELNVSTVAQAQGLFRQAKIENKAFTFQEKKGLVEKLENKSHRECEKILAEANPLPNRPTRERVIGAARTEIRFEANDALYSKIQKLKAQYAHKLKGSNDFADLLKILVDQAIEKPKQSVPALKVKPIASSRSSTSRYIPKQIREQARARAEHKCTYVDPTTKRRCASVFALEFDHIMPLALGGKTEEGNIRVFCRTHNQLAAIQSLGLHKMEPYLNHLRMGFGNAVPQT